MEPTRPHEETLAWLRLALSPGLGARDRRLLLSAHENDAAKAARELPGEPAAHLLESTLAWLSQPECHLLTLQDPQYPPLLREITDPPPVLYAQGRLELLSLPALAIVGSRNATPRGLDDARAFAQALSDAGLAIVSGLALGIDAAAHRGGLAGASSSIAVMGTGPEQRYPRGNQQLAQELAAHGCLLSEFHVGTPPDKRNFPRRNRLISGMSRGVLVVEAALASGSIITAHAAVDQGRDVFAIPGSIHSPLSKGCHCLIKEGAKLVDSADDILLELRMPIASILPEARRRATPAPRRDGVLALLHRRSREPHRPYCCYTRGPTHPAGNGRNRTIRSRLALPAPEITY